MSDQIPPRKIRPAGPAARTVVVALGVPLTVMAFFGGPPAAGDDSDSGLESIAEIVPDDGLDPRLLALDFEGAAYRESVERLESAMFSREENRRALHDSRVDADALRDAIRRLSVEEERARTNAERAGLDLERIESELASRAVERFVRHGSGYDDQLDPRRSVDERRSAVLSAEADEAQLALRRELEDRLEDNRSLMDGLRSDRVSAQRALLETTARLEDLVETVLRLDGEVTRAEENVRAARRGARVRSVGIPVIAMDAYLKAESRLAAAEPTCGLRWWMLAGVARVESRHGEIGGRSLRADGRVDQPIVGVALDGGPRVRLVADTDGGALDGDRRYDRAVGPLQFIPETWSRLGRDANGDGRVDPQSIYDASLAAGHYLCDLASDLESPSGLAAALFGYNRSSEYVDLVTEHARRYSGRELMNGS